MLENIKTKFNRRIASYRSAAEIIGMGVLFSTAAAAQNLSIEPQLLEVYGNDAAYNTTFSIRVHISGDDVSGIQFNLNYDSGIIEAVNLSEGDFLKTGDSGVLTIPPLIDNDIGVVKFASARIGKNGASGSGNVANITFKTKTSGVTELKLNEIKIKDPNLNTIHTEVISGTVVVKNAPEDVKPEKIEKPEKPENTVRNPAQNSPNNYFLITSIIIIVLLIIAFSKFIKNKGK